MTNIGDRIKSGMNGLNSVVNSGLKAFQNGSQGIHQAAVAALWHALEKGDTRILDKVLGVITAVKPKEAGMFKSWVGANSTIVIENAEGERKNKLLLKLVDDGQNGKKFKFSEGVSENMRIGHFDLEKGLTGTPYYRWEKEKSEAKEFGTLELLKMAANFPSSMTKKATDSGLEIPPIIMAALEELRKAMKGFDLEMMEFQAKREKRAKILDELLNKEQAKIA